MGFAKNEMLRFEGLTAIASDVLVKAKAGERCESHEEIVVSLGDPDALKRAYAIGTNMIKNGEVDASRQEFMDAIKSASEDMCDDTCPHCAKNMED